jgi:hypothetical protein
VLWPCVKVTVIVLHNYVVLHFKRNWYIIIMQDIFYGWLCFKNWKIILITFCCSI